MDAVIALKKLNGVARMRDLRIFGIGREQIWADIRAQRLIRPRNGWVALPTTSPIELRAISEHGLLTCASAAAIRGLPVAAPHFHLRGKLDRNGAMRSVKRKAPDRRGACVGLRDMVIDYVECQLPEWSTALVDHLTRTRALTKDQWLVIENALPKRLARIVSGRSTLPESPLESIMRFRLAQERIPFSMQVELGRFRVDFVIGIGLIIETHGAEFHSSAPDWERDRRKVAWLRSQGWDVLEFSYLQIVNEWESVLSAIMSARSRQPKGS